MEFGILTACLLIAFGKVTNVFAAEIWTHTIELGRYKEIIIEGIIEKGDHKKFIHEVRQGNGQVGSVLVYSPGGDFYEAMKIGRVIRGLELASMVPMQSPQGMPSCDSDKFPFLVEPNHKNNCICASACFFIHIGGVHRNGTFMAVHRPYFVKGRFGELPMRDAKIEFVKLQNEARIYMGEMGVPVHIQEDILGTSSDKLLLLDEKAVKIYFFGALPYRKEWLLNKCSKLTPEETARMINYSQKFSDAGYSSSVFTSEEKKDRNSISKKLQDEWNCAATESTKSREAAFIKYFNLSSK